MEMAERVEKLEAQCRELRRQVRRSRTTALAAAVAVAVLTSAADLVAQQSDIAAVVRARRFEVVGGPDDRMAVAYMTATPEGHGMLELVTAEGNPTVSLRTNAAGSGAIRTMNRAGYPLFIAEPTAAGTGFTSVYDGNGGQLAMMYGSTAGGSISIYGKGGYPLVTVDPAKQGGRLKVFAENGRPVVVAAAAADRSGELRMMNGHGLLASELVSVEGGAGRLSVFSGDAGTYSVPEWLSQASPPPGSCPLPSPETSPAR
ncbi:MAG TPA: hypothetical protein VEC57_08180 [Candidatus Limnocylindrales bacterium]|nr:hypothetical protein [Candidatus Limnocylindrales bacterium]